MEKYKLFVDEIDGSEYAIIDYGNETYTSMPKAEYDRRQVEHLTEITTPDEA